MSATVAAALKKVAVAVFTDKKSRKYGDRADTRHYSCNRNADCGIYFGFKYERGYGFRGP